MATSQLPNHHLRNKDGWDAYDGVENQAQNNIRRAKLKRDGFDSIDPVDDRIIEDKFEESKDFFQRDEY